ncbi:hypothetical protein ACEWY4_014156 [Coilia grayii]|uniref:Transcriptional protein SWT1 n=1 Tax=Coilia grayii TaxID=363190 RepID=A0ABD1JRG9_9TELE
MSKSKKKKHRKSKHRTPSPEKEEAEGAQKQRRGTSEKKEECHRNQHRSAVGKRKAEDRDRTLPHPQRKKSSPDRSRELKKPAYRLHTTSVEKKDSRKGGEGTVAKTEHHRRNEDNVAGKKRRTSNPSPTASAKDRKSVPVSYEANRSHGQSYSTPSPVVRKDRVPSTQERSSGSGVKANHRISSALSSTVVKNTSLNLQEQRRKLVGRRSEGQDYEPPAKASRSTPAPPPPPRQPEELREARSMLVERRRRRSVEEEIKASVSLAKQEKGAKEGERRRTSGTLTSASSKLTGSARPDSAASTPPQRPLGTPSSGTTKYASPKPQPMISFRIPKKPSPALPQADIWKERDQSPAQSATPPEPKLLSTAREGPDTVPHKSLSTTVPKQQAPKHQQTTALKHLSTSEAGWPAASPKPLFIPRTIKPVKLTPPTCKPQQREKDACDPQKFQSNVPDPQKFQSNVCDPQTFQSNVCDPQTFQSNLRYPEKFQSNVCDPQKFQSNVPDPQKFQSNVCDPQTFQSNLRYPEKFQSNVCDPQKFQSAAESFSAPVRLPEQSLVKQPITASQPSIWSTQTVSSASFILPENNHDVGDSDQEMQLLEELQQARCEHRLQVNVVECYGELTAMDIDPPDEGAPSSPVFSKEIIQQELIIVMDTNILLSHLDVVKKIRSHGLGALGFPTVLIPWVVLQELDAIKNGKLTNAGERRATPAVHYIYSCLKNQEPRLWGQSMQQASQALCGLQTENNDDRVLQCCLQYQKLCPKSGLILCTNDKNLCSKAVLSGVRALSKADLMQEVDRLKPGVLSPTITAGQGTACPSWQPVQKDGDRSRVDPCTPKAGQTEQREEKERRRAVAAACQLSECVCLLEDSLKGALSAILAQEMKEAYGDLWNEIVLVKPPWSLSDVLQCMMKHWIAVFGNIVQRGLKSNVTQLSECLCSGKSVDVECVCQAVGLAVELLSGFGSRGDYAGLLPQTINTLQGLPHCLLPQADRSPKADGDSVMVEEVASGSGALHGDVWQLFDIMWANVLEHR